jgi:multidrug efflux pump subunit AcrB
LKRVAGTRNIYTIGGTDQVVRVMLDPQRLAGYHISLADLRAALSAANVSHEAGALVANNQEVLVRAGTLLSSVDDVASLVVGMRDGAPVYLRDVATVSRGPDQPEKYVRFGTGAAAQKKGIEAKGEFPAVTIAVAKKPGTNAVEIADRIIQRVDQLKGTFIPKGVEVTVTRNYGATANDKAMKLIMKLVFATASVVLLVWLTLGRREAFIVGTAVVVTLATTLFASWAWGFTINRVSLFALIFSIGILVDDAIVVVENIHRHRQLGGKTLAEAIPLAVDEVGGPTILATFTVIAALLPMAFVTGLMGPYMSPIPINASMGMIISLLVAFIVTPWLTYKVLHHAKHHTPHGDAHSGPLYRFFQRLIGPFLHEAKGRSRRWGLFAAILALIALSVSLVGFKAVVLKMLPFDNKSEFQVVVDMPEGTSVEQTERVLHDLGAYLATVPEVTDYETYAGTASPINFNGLVRQYYLRSGADVGDIQVNLVDKHHRHRKSHDIALAVRAPLQAIAKPFDANVKIVEVPPGPPVQAPLVAEIYGIDYDGQIRVAQKVRSVFESTPDVVDVDDSVEAPQAQLILHVDRDKAALLGVGQKAISDAVAAAVGGEDVSYLHDARVKYPVPIRIELPTADKANLDFLMNIKVHAAKGNMVPLSELLTVVHGRREHAIYHKDLLPVVFVTGDMAGKLDSPLYGMFSIYAHLNKMPIAAESGETIKQYLLKQPDDPYRYSLKWDGEWQITYETFRDMGIAYSVGLVLIYLLVVAQFRSYLVPLIIMAPIPLTIIGVMPGHALLSLFMDAKFTATSMIGMIALAGIIVRNSILLVDFINHELQQGTPFAEAVIRSSAVRAKPIVLTALAAMLGAFFILDDPIFSGLAISLIFGVLVSTALTLMVIPIMYYAWMRKRWHHPGEG